MPNREFLLPPPDGLYGRQGSFPSPKHTPIEAQQPFRGLMNRTSYDPALYRSGYYQSQAYGMRQRKAARAQQVQYLSLPI
jgi:hypothetical protein